VDEQVLYKKRGIGMFVSPTARDALRAQRRQTFFSDVVDPMVAEASAVGIPLDEVVGRIQRLAGQDGMRDGKEDR
jgi:GntR family transcriptional regulator